MPPYIGTVQKSDLRADPDIRFKRNTLCCYALFADGFIRLVEYVLLGMEGNILPHHHVIADGDTARRADEGKLAEAAIPADFHAFAESGEMVGRADLRIGA